MDPINVSKRPTAPVEPPLPGGNLNDSVRVRSLHNQLVFTTTRGAANDMITKRIAEVVQ